MNTIVLDDSPLGRAVANNCAVSQDNILQGSRLLNQVNWEDISTVLVHVSYGREKCLSGAGVRIAEALRRDYRFKGKIILYSIEVLGALTKRHRFLQCVKYHECNVAFFTLPEQFEHLGNALTTDSSGMLSHAQLVECILKFCELDIYFKRGWGDLAHLLQADDSLKNLPQETLLFLIRNTKDFGPHLVQRRYKIDMNADDASLGRMPSEVNSALTIVESALAQPTISLPIGIKDSIGVIQNWLSDAPTTKTLSNVAALPNYSLMLIADDDLYDSHQLELLGYRVEQANDQQEAIDLLEECYPIFLCDLTWWGDQQIGLHLARLAVQQGVPIVIVMSVGSIEHELPSEIVVCEGIGNKNNASYIHNLIVKRAIALEESDNASHNA